MTDSDVTCWQHDGYWVFFCRSRPVKSQMIHMCRTQLGKSHGEQSAWCLKHVPYVFAPGHLIVVIQVKDVHMVTQLRLAYT